MNKEESLDLYNKGHEAWNAWAKEMLDQQIKLKEAGQWVVNDDSLILRGENHVTRLWFATARADFSEHTFDTDTCFEDFVFPGEAAFIGAKFAKRASFDRAKFGDVAEFKGATFCRMARFAAARFGGVADFMDSRFGGVGWFQYADFQYAKFEGHAKFWETTFHSGSDFRGAEFRDVAWFEGATFSLKSGFEQVVFGGKAEFGKTTFENEAQFRFATFGGEADFKGVTFGSHADFYEAEFRGHADFQRTKFSGKSEFGRAAFQNEAKFMLATFGGEADFKGVTFGGGTDFNKTTFSGEAEFYETSFIGSAMFYRARFMSDARFDHAKFLTKEQGSQGEAGFNLALFESYTSFYGVIFEYPSTFVAIKGQSFFSLKNVTFLSIPDFEQAHFAEAPTLDHSQFVAAGNEKDVAIRWRALRRLAAHGHDHERELIFLAEEVKSLREVQDQRWPCSLNLFSKRKWVWPGAGRYWFGLIYQGFSDFGRSTFRPFLTWVILIFAFGLIYFSQRSVENIPSTTLSNCEPYLDALYLSIHNGLVIPGLGRSETLARTYACLYGTGQENVPYPVVFAGLGQTVISAVLIFLFLLALRNYFRIK